MRSASMYSLMTVLMFMLTSCGGGGGSTATTTPPPPVVPDVMVGSIAFNAATSRNLTSLSYGFPAGTAWNWKYKLGTDAPIDQSTTTFSNGTAAIGGDFLPCILSTTTSPLYANTYYSLLAVAKNGGLYCLTPDLAFDGHYETGEATVISSGEPRLILPPTPTIGFSWSHSRTGSYTSFSLANAPRSIEALNVTSPNGFTGCLKIRAVGANDMDGKHTEIIEYWKDGYGLIEKIPEDYDAMGALVPFDQSEFRSGVAFSG